MLIYTESGHHTRIPMEQQNCAQHVAANIRRLLNKLSITNAELAKRSNISSAAVSKILSGKMNITINMALAIAQGLNCSLDEILQGIDNKATTRTIKTDDTIKYHIGIMSLERKRFATICDTKGKILATSTLDHGLDLVETANALLEKITESIGDALNTTNIDNINPKQATLNLVTQSSEFSETKTRFLNFIERKFAKVHLLSDWQLTYFSTFNHKTGISLILDKGTSLSYLHGDELQKIGGWKFPVCDFAGENWLGNQVAKHTISAKEGFIPMSKLAKDVLSRYGNSIDKLVEACFKTNDKDVFSNFYQILLPHYYQDSAEAIDLVYQGKMFIKDALELAAKKIGKKPDLTISGSLKDIYQEFIHKQLHFNIIEQSETEDKVKFLAMITEDYLKKFKI